MNDTLRRDLDEILERSENDIACLRNAHVFVTGGTGFVGRWLLQAILRANRRQALNAHVSVLTRSPSSFRDVAPALACDDAITLITGDVCSAEISERVDAFDMVIHAATPSSASLNRERPLVMLQTIIDGGRNALEIAARTPGSPFLFTSSGAVYGRLPADVVAMSESSPSAPDVLSPGNAYAEGKRVGELLCALMSQQSAVTAKIARLFAFIGPFLPLDRHFAAGNFIRDALASDAIRVRGDGRTIRSYLYASEMIMALFAVLARGEPCRAYNVGSAVPVTIEALATAISRACSPELPVSIESQVEERSHADVYVPSTDRIEAELGFRSTITLEESIRRTLAFYRLGDRVL